MHSRDAGPETKASSDPAFTGREQELKELESFLNLAAEGKGRTVFVSGEAGSGKTRLTTEFLNQAKRRGAIVLAGNCLGNVTVPYFPFIEAFDTYFSARDDEEQYFSVEQTEGQFGLGSIALFGSENSIATRLSGPKRIETFGRQEGMSAQVWRDQTFAAVARTLHSVSISQPLIFFLEDAHWADSASLGLLHYLAKVIGSEKVLLLATFRSEELTTDEEGRPHPLVEALRLMKRENLFHEIRLQGLGKQDVGKVAESMVSGSIDPQLIGRLADESQGNPLFIVESLRMLQERKSLLQENNQWCLSVSELTIPTKIKEIILHRLGALKLSQRRVLDAASVIGDKFDVELLVEVLKEDYLDVLETLNFVAQSTSLVCCEQDYFRFDHAKSRETLYEEIPLPLKKGYHARVAEKLETSAKKGRLPLSALAFHYAQAGNQQKALEYSIEAGKEELTRFSNAEAISHFKYALDIIGENPEQTNERLVCLEGLGDAYNSNSMFKEAAKTFELLASLTTGVAKLLALNKAMAALVTRAADDKHLLELENEAEKYSNLDRLAGATLIAHKGFRLWVEGNTAAGLEVCSEAVRVLEEEYSLWGLASLLSIFGSLCVFNEKLEEGVVAFLRSIALSSDFGDYRLQAHCLQTAGQLMYINCGTTEESARMLEKAASLAERIADYNKLAETYIVWSWTLAASNLQTAINKGLKAVEYAEKTDSERVKAMVFSTLAKSYVYYGDMENAEKYYNKLINLPKEILQVAGPQGLQTIALFLAAKGQWKESNEYFQKQFELNKRLSPGARANYMSHYAWALEKQGRNEEAKKLREEAQTVRRGLAKRFEHINLQTIFMAPINIVVGQEFEARLDMINPSGGKGFLVRIESLLPPEFETLKITPESTTHDGVVEMQENTIEPFAVKTIKLTLKVTKPGTLTLSPKTVYIDDLDRNRVSTSTPVKLTAMSAEPIYEILPNRVATGTAELDRLLLGGIPQGYGLILIAPSSNEREQLIRRFIETGARSGETTLYLTCNLNNVAFLVESQVKMYCLLCNAQADSALPSSPNIFKLKGVENLTEIDIAMTKFFRSLNQSTAGPRRILVEIVSDVLLQHHAIITRRWLASLLPTFKSKGFTTLAVIDPQMHAPEGVQAILSLFDGEIRIKEKETPQGFRQTLRVKRLNNQKFLEDELTVNKEKPE